jgi:hypothetical protein
MPSYAYVESFVLMSVGLFGVALQTVIGVAAA